MHVCICVYIYIYMYIYIIFVNAREDWNQCSAILVQCLSGGEPKQKPVPFRV